MIVRKLVNEDCLKYMKEILDVDVTSGIYKKQKFF